MNLAALSSLWYIIRPELHQNFNLREILQRTLNNWHLSLNLSQASRILKYDLTSVHLDGNNGFLGCRASTIQHQINEQQTISSWRVTQK